MLSTNTFLPSQAGFDSHSFSAMRSKTAEIKRPQGAQSAQNNQVIKPTIERGGLAHLAASLLSKESGFVTLASLETPHRVEREGLVLGLRRLYQLDLVDHMPGNGSANSRYKLKPGARAWIEEVGSISSVNFSNTSLEGLPNITFSRQTASVEMVRLEQPLADPAPPISTVPNMLGVGKPKRSHLRKPSAHGEAQTPAPPAWANPLPSAVSANDFRLVGGCLSFHLSRRPGGLSFSLLREDALAWARAVLALRASIRKKNTSPRGPNVIEAQPLRIAMIGNALVMRLSRRPGGRSVMMEEGQAVAAAQQVQALLGNCVTVVDLKSR